MRHLIPARVHSELVQDYDYHGENPWIGVTNREASQIRRGQSLSAELLFWLWLTTSNTYWWGDKPWMRSLTPTRLAQIVQRRALICEAFGHALPEEWIENMVTMLEAIHGKSLVSPMSDFVRP